MRIAVGSDHAGFHLKEMLAGHLRDAGHEIVDCGTHSDARVDYPDFGAAVGRAVRDGAADGGVCVCGSGIGIAMAANKIDGIRAATVHDDFTAAMCREHNDANVMCMGARVIPVSTMKRLVDIYTTTAFGGGRHAGRVAKIMALEENGASVAS